MSLQTEWKTVQILISWLLMKPTDQDLHCFQDRINPGSAGQGFFMYVSDLLQYLSVSVLVTHQDTSVTMLKWHQVMLESHLLFQIHW